MCIFSPVAAPRGLLSSLFGARGPAVHVSGTRIFARVEGARQALVYSMKLAVGSDVAMVLPLPVAAGCGEDAVQFVDLSGYERLFEDLEVLFAPPPPQSKGPPSRRGEQSARLTLAVRSVGAFDASFVPTIRDFDRLDARFRLPDAVWSALPGYHDWGFAVFTLKKGDARVHPMALWFPTRDPARTFFPTVHVHDGEVHERAAFDHALFWQGSHAASEGDATSHGPFWPHAAGRTHGIALAEPVTRRQMRGEHPNRDVWIG